MITKPAARLLELHGLRHLYMPNEPGHWVRSRTHARFYNARKQLTLDVARRVVAAFAGGRDGPDDALWDWGFAPWEIEPRRDTTKEWQLTAADWVFLDAPWD